MNKTNILFFVIVVPLLLSVFTPLLNAEAYTHTDSTSLAQSYWGRTLINTGDSAFIHPVNAYSESYKEAMIVNEDTDYAWTNTSAYFQYESTLDNDLEYTDPDVITDCSTVAGWNVQNGVGTIGIDTVNYIEGNASMIFTSTNGAPGHGGVRYTVPGLQDISASEFLSMSVIVSAERTGETLTLRDNVGAWITFSVTFSTSWRHFVFALQDPLASGGGAFDYTNLAFVDTYFGSDVDTGDTANIDYVIGDVGNWVKIEINTPDALDSTVVNVEVSSYDGAAYQSFMSYDADDDSEVHINNTLNLYYLDGTTAADVYPSKKGYNEAMAGYAQDIRGATPTIIISNATEAGPITYSDNQGTTERVSVGLTLPPDDGQDSATDGISQIQLRVRITYANQLTTLNEGPEYGYQTFLDKTELNDNWLNVSLATAISSEHVQADFEDFVLVENATVFNQPTNDDQVWINRTDYSALGGYMGNSWNLTYIMPGYSSLKEHNNTAGTDNIEIVKLGSSLNMSSTPVAAVNAEGLIFQDFPTEWLDGKNVTVVWQGFTAGAIGAEIVIYDGVYQRNNDTQFPDGAALTTQGNGLVQTIIDRALLFGVTTDTAIVDVSTASYDDVTLMIRFYNHGAAANFVQVFNITVYDAWGGHTLWQNNFTSTPVSEVSGTGNNYGYVTVDLDSTEDVTLTENMNYWRTVPYYNINLMTEGGNNYNVPSVTISLLAPLNDELIFNQIPHPLNLGLYTAPTQMVIDIAGGTANYNRTQPVSSSYESMFFYIGNPAVIQYFNVWINELVDRYKDGWLYVYKRTPTTENLIDVVPFNHDLALPPLLADNLYGFRIFSSNLAHEYVFGDWLTDTYSLTINIVQIPLDFDGVWKPLAWTVTRANVTNTITVTAELFTPYTGDFTVRLYNVTRDLVNGPTNYLGVTGFTHNWAGGVRNQSYTVYLNGSIDNYVDGFLEKKDSPRLGNSPLVDFQIISGSYLGPNASIIFSIVSLGALAMVFSRTNKVAGMIIVTSMTGLFLYFQWLPSSVISWAMYSMLVLFTIFYTARNQGADEGATT